MQTNIRISLVEDEQGTRDQLAAWLRSVDGLQLIAAYGSGEEAVRDIQRRMPDVLLVDLHLPGLSGAECVRQTKLRAPSVKVIVLTKYDNAESIFEALRAGADGYILKRRIVTQLLPALRDVLEGGAPLSSEVAACIVAFFKRPQGEAPALAELTRRELEVLEHLALGESYKEIAVALGITFQTVNSYVKLIYEKLHVHSRTEAARKYLGH